MKPIPVLCPSCGQVDKSGGIAVGGFFAGVYGYQCGMCGREWEIRVNFRAADWCRSCGEEVSGDNSVSMADGRVLCARCRVEVKR